MVVKIFTTAFCLIGMLLTLQPLLLMGQSARDIDTAINAVQNQRLSTLEQSLNATSVKLDGLEGKVNLILGGVSGIYGVFGLLGINSILGAAARAKGKTQ